MLDKAKAFVKEHKEEIVVASVFAGYTTLALAIGYNLPHTVSNRVKGASEGVINGERVLAIDFYDGTSQILREPAK